MSEVPTLATVSTTRSVGKDCVPPIRRLGQSHRFSPDPNVAIVPASILYGGQGTPPRRGPARPSGWNERTFVKITIIGTGFIGSTLGRALSGAGHQVTYGSRHADDEVAAGTTGNVLPIDQALLDAEVVILALPGAAVADLTVEHGSALAGRLVIDATNQMGADVANARASLPPSVRYARSTRSVGRTWLTQYSPMEGPTCSFPLRAATDPRLRLSLKGWAYDRFTWEMTKKRSSMPYSNSGLRSRSNKGAGRRLALRLLEG